MVNEKYSAVCCCTGHLEGRATVLDGRMRHSIGVIVCDEDGRSTQMNG